MPSSSFVIDGLTVQPLLDQSFGAEVSGVDWRKPVPKAVIQSVRLDASNCSLLQYDMLLTRLA